MYGPQKLGMYIGLDCLNFMKKALALTVVFRKVYFPKIRTNKESDVENNRAEDKNKHEIGRN